MFPRAFQCSAVLFPRKRQKKKLAGNAVCGYTLSVRKEPICGGVILARRGTFGRVIVLLFLIVILLGGGLLWFDYLGILHTRHLFAPVYALFGMQNPEGISTLPSQPGNLDEDRIARRLEAADIRSQELDLREAELDRREQEMLRAAQELAERQATVEEQERSFAGMLQATEDRAANIRVIAGYMNGMPPQAAVDNLLAMDDQDVIDVLRAAEDMAAQEGRASSVAYWFSLMPPERAAEIQRKMTSKPRSLPAG